MASLFKLCPTKDSYLAVGVPWYVKDPVDVDRNSSQISPQVKEHTVLKNVYVLFDKSPKRVNVSTPAIHCSGYANNNEMGRRKTGNLIDNDAIHDEICEKSAASMQVTCYEAHATERQYVIRAIRSFVGDGHLELGRAYHATVVKMGLGFDVFVGTSLIDVYAKCGDMESAVRLFNVMPCLDVALCNCLISGYARNGLFGQAFHFFMEIGSNGVEPNHYTYSVILAACRMFSAIEEGKQIHARVVKSQHLSNTAVSNALLTMYSACGMMDEAELTFICLAQKNIISWTAIINGFYQHGDFKKALKVFCFMGETSVDPNEHTFTTALASCGCMKDPESGRMLHAQVIKKGMALSDFVGSAIVDMYSGLGEIDKAELQIKTMGASTVSWNALIAGFVNNEKTNEAVKAFSHMVENDVVCDEFTYSIMLKACSSLQSLATCQQTHSRALKTKLETNTHVGSSLIEAYTKCGCLEDAEKVFSQLPVPDVISWNSMIKAYSQNSYPNKAISLLRKMVEEGNRPTSSTFLAILSACSHSGLVQEGYEFFKSMIRNHGISPEEIHYSCMVDLLGRAHKLEDALDFINNLPIKPTAPMWRPLLAACRYHSNLPMAEYAAKKILELDPNDAAVYVTLANLYAEQGRYADVEEQRKLMTIKNVTKEPGCSWIEVNNKMYRFFSHDKRHRKTPEVYDKLQQVMRQMKDNGHSASTSLEPESELGQSKKDDALYHSEKLAVCFGLLSLPAGKPIRVFKNLRVCTDCHLFMKQISLATEREILLRDNYRFHHFKQGSCSCGDYW